MRGRMTLFRSDRGCLAKTWSLDAEGKPTKATAAQLTEGTFEIREFSSAAELAALIGAVTTKEAVSASLPANGLTEGRVTTRKAQQRQPEALTRTKRDFGLPSGPGFVLLDHDAPSGAEGFDRDRLWSVLLSCVPELGGAGAVWFPSGSSHIRNGPGEVTGIRGQHLYLMLRDASDGPRLVHLIAQRLWLAGHGSVQVSKAGSLLVRSPVDEAVTDPARLIFSGGAECVPPLSQHRGSPVVLQAGGFLDSRLIPDLSAEELGRYQALVEQEKAAKAAEAAQAKAVHRAAAAAEGVPRLMAKGVAAGEAEQRIGESVDAALSGTLLADFVLTIVHDDGGCERVTVGDVLADRARWHESQCLDPLNPDHRGGAADAMLYLHGTSPAVYSFDDGGRVYRLKGARQRIAVSPGRRGELVEALTQSVASLPYLFSTSTGPVLLDGGRPLPLNVDRLMNVVGREFALYRPAAKGDAPADLTREVAGLVLAALTN